MNEYIEQANRFLEGHYANITIKFKERICNPWGDEMIHDLYDVTIRRDGYAPYSCTFTQSAYRTMTGQEPTAYDVLACMEKYGYESYKDFCEECYYPDSEKSLDLYNRVMDEYRNIERLFGDCMEDLREIG